MKPLVFIILSFLLLSFVDNKPKNDLEKNHLKGQVQTITEISSFKKELTKDFFKYNRLGNLIEEDYSGFGYDSALLNRSNMLFYDSNSRLSYYKTKYLKQETNHKCKYDISGRLTCEYTSDSIGNIVGKDSSVYDNKGNVVECITYQRNANNPWRKINVDTFYYDRKNNLVENYKTKYLGNDTMYSVVGYKIYENGETKEVDYFENKRCTSIFHMKYIKFDKQGNWIKAIMNDELSNEKDTIHREIKYYQ